MSFDEDKKRKELAGKEQSSLYEGKTHVEKLKKEIVEGKKQMELADLKLDVLKTNIQKQEQKTKPAQDRKREIMDAKEQTQDAVSFTKKSEERQKALDQALKQEPEQEGEAAG